jgi:predicted amidohydrolase
MQVKATYHKLHLMKVLFSNQICPGGSGQINGDYELLRGGCGICMCLELCVDTLAASLNEKEV